MKTLTTTLFAFGIVLLLCQNSCSQSNTSPNPQEFERGLLWSIRAPGSDRISYLLGTVHQMDTASIKLPLLKLEQLAAKADMICVETIIKNDSLKQQTSRYAKQMILDDTTQNVMNSLDQKSKEKLVEIFRSPNLSFMLPMLSKMEPGLIMLMITMQKQGKIKSPFFKAINFSPETHFKNFATERNKKIAGLEKSGGSITQLKSDKQSFPEIITQMKQQLAAFDKQDDIYEAYHQEQLNATQLSFINDSSFVARNTVMARSIDSLIQNHGLFIMVGMAHLSGEKGVLYQLAQKGYQLKNIKLF
jgi:uncharacterized protein YbaP (TraB family)